MKHHESGVELEQPLGATLYPIGLYAISGLASHGSQFLAVDKVKGYLASIDSETHNTSILNPDQTEDWLDCSGLAVDAEQVWFARDNTVFCASGLNAALSGQLLSKPQAFASLDYPIHGVAVDAERVYLTCQKSGYIHVFDRATKRVIARFPHPGIGPESLTFARDKLWVSDSLEQTVYCLDPDTGAVEFSVLTPFRSPTGLTFFSPSATESPICFIAYSDSIPYVRDDPNADPPQIVAWRDRTFIHPLNFHHDPSQSKTLSNGYLIEMSYVEELEPLDPLHLEQVEWRIALPSQTPRQRIRQIEPVGMPFRIEKQAGAQVACFNFDQLPPDRKGLLGWKVLIEVYGLKYSWSYDDVEDATELPPGFAERYLIDNDDLAMDSPIVQAAAREAVGTETNILRKMHRIRNYVYERLRYGIRPRIDRPDVVLERGIGSCGEYVGVLLALARLNGIACRTIGRYKCPPHPEQRHLPLEPDFNHVWLEFYIPGVGWLPMESNVDDVEERGPYPDRFFMGLAWYHIEIGKGIPFEKMMAKNQSEKLSIGDFALNHIQFRILEELVPSTQVLAPSFEQLAVSESQ